jgi:hypothetical protein
VHRDRQTDRHTDTLQIRTRTHTNTHILAHLYTILALGHLNKDTGLITAQGRICRLENRSLFAAVCSFHTNRVHLCVCVCVCVCVCNGSFKSLRAPVDIDYTQICTHTYA